MKKKKLFSLVLATVLTAATVLPCYGASTKEKISNAQAEQAAAQSQLDSIQSRIDELNSKKGQSEEYLSELNQQLDDLQNRLQELQDQYDAKQNELVQIQADLEDAKAKEEEQYEAMKLRIQYMYENSSGNGYMAMLFSSKSISELISRAEYIQKISDFDRDLMQEYEDTVDQVKEKETQVQEEQAAIVELQQQSSDQQEAIQELYAAAYQELRTYSAELDDAKSSESALVDEINSKADAINDLIRQAKEEEIAAQKKAEEEAAAAAAAQQAAAEAEAEAARKQAAEAARVAAAEAANAAAKADTDTSSSSGSSSSDSSASSTTTGSPSASDTSSSSSSGTYLGRFKLTGYCSCSIWYRTVVRRIHRERNHTDRRKNDRHGRCTIRNETDDQRPGLHGRRPRNRLRPRRHLLQQPFRGAELRRAVCRCISAELRNKDKRYAGTELPAYLFF